MRFAPDRCRSREPGSRRLRPLAVIAYKALEMSARAPNFPLVSPLRDKFGTAASSAGWPRPLNLGVHNATRLTQLFIAGVEEGVEVSSAGRHQQSEPHADTGDE